MVHDWTAPTSGDVTFRALCGAGGYIDEMWTASEVMVSLDANATSTTIDANATTTTTTTTLGRPLREYFHLSCWVEEDQIQESVFSCWVQEDQIQEICFRGF